MPKLTVLHAPDVAVADVSDGITDAIDAFMALYRDLRIPKTEDARMRKLDKRIAAHDILVVALEASGKHACLTCGTVADGENPNGHLTADCTTCAGF